MVADAGNEEEWEGEDLSEGESEGDVLEEELIVESEEEEPLGVKETARIIHGDDEIETTFQRFKDDCIAHLEVVLSAEGLSPEERAAVRGEIEVWRSVPNVHALRGLATSNFLTLIDLENLELPSGVVAALKYSYDFDTNFIIAGTFGFVTHLHIRPPATPGEARLDVNRCKVHIGVRGDGQIIWRLAKSPPLSSFLRSKNFHAAVAAVEALRDHPRPANQVVACLPIYRNFYLGHHPTVDADVYVVDVALRFKLPSPGRWRGWGLLRKLYTVAPMEWPLEGQKGYGYHAAAVVASHVIPAAGGRLVQAKSSYPSMGPGAAMLAAERTWDEGFVTAFLASEKAAALVAEKVGEATSRYPSVAEFEAEWGVAEESLRLLAAPGGAAALIARQAHRQRPRNFALYSNDTVQQRAEFADEQVAAMTTEIVSGLDFAVDVPQAAKYVNIFPTVGFEVDTVVRPARAQPTPLAFDGASWCPSKMSDVGPVLDQSKLIAAAAHPAVVAATGGGLRRYSLYGNFSKSAGACGMSCAAGMPLEPGVPLDDLGMAQFIAGWRGIDGVARPAATIGYAPGARRILDPMHMLFQEAKARKLGHAAVESSEAELKEFRGHVGGAFSDLRESVKTMSTRGALRFERTVSLEVEPRREWDAASEEALEAAVRAYLIEPLLGLKVEALVSQTDVGAMKAYLQAYFEALQGLCDLYLRRSGGAPQAVVLALACQGLAIAIMESFQPGRQLSRFAKRTMKQVFITGARRGFPFFGRELLSGLVGLELASEEHLRDGQLNLSDGASRAAIVAEGGRKYRGARNDIDAVSPAARRQLFRGVMAAVAVTVDPLQWPGLWNTVRGVFLLMAAYHSKLGAVGVVVLMREVRGRFRLPAGVLVACLKILGAGEELLARFDCEGHRLPVAELLAGPNAVLLGKVLASGGAHTRLLRTHAVSPREAAHVFYEDALGRLQREAGVTGRSSERSAYLSVVDGMVDGIATLAPYAADCTDRSPHGVRRWALDKLAVAEMACAAEAAASGSGDSLGAHMIFTAKSWKEGRLDGVMVQPATAAEVEMVKNTLRAVRGAQARYRHAAGAQDPMKPLGLAAETPGRVVERLNAAAATLLQTGLRAVAGPGQAALLGGEGAPMRLRDVPYRRDVLTGELAEVLNHEENSEYSGEEEAAPEYEPSSGDDDEEAQAEQELEELEEEATPSPTPTPPPSTSSSSSDSEEEERGGAAAAELDEAPVARRTRQGRGRGGRRGGGRGQGRGDGAVGGAAAQLEGGRGRRGGARRQQEAEAPVRRAKRRQSRRNR